MAISDDGFGPVERGGPTVQTDTPQTDTPLTDTPRTEPSRAPGRGTDDGFGPAEHGRRRRLPRIDGPHLPRPRLGGVFRGLLTIVMVAVLLLAGTAAGLLVYASLRMERNAVSGLAGGAPTMNTLVVGSDSRDGLTPEELLALGTEAVDGRRTDTIFVLSTSGGSAALLSFPRDLLVTRCDGTRGRINGAYSTGGPSCLAETISATSGIPITHYAEVNLAGLKTLVDAVGGVTLFLDAPLADRAAGIDLPAGCVTLDGTQALGFVRARSVDSDLGRIGRQQRFIAELADEVMTPERLANPVALFEVAGAGASALTVDQGFGPIDLLRLGRAGRGFAGAGLASYTVPTTADRFGDAAVLAPVEAEAEGLYQQFRDGSILAVAAAPAGPADVTVDVRNGAGEVGLAGAVAEALRGQGFGIGEVGNAELAAATVVRHPPGLQAAAALVASRVAGATTAVTEGSDRIELVLAPGATVTAAEPPATAAPADPAAPPPAPADC